MKIKLCNQELFGKGVKLVEYLNNKLLKATPNGPYDQVIINWLNTEVNKYIKYILLEKKMPDVGYCCSQSL